MSGAPAGALAPAGHGDRQDFFHWRTAHQTNTASATTSMTMPMIQNALMQGLARRAQLAATARPLNFASRW